MKSTRLQDWGWYILIACVAAGVWLATLSIWLSIGLARIG